MPFHKLFLLVLLITMETSLFNYSDRNGQTKNIDSIEIIGTLKTEIIPKVKIDSNKQVQKSTGSTLIKNIESIPENFLTGEVVEIMGIIAPPKMIM